MMRRPTTPRRRSARPARRPLVSALAAGVVGLLAVSTAVPASAQEAHDHAEATAPSDDPFVRQQQLERRRQELASELDALQATNEELQAVLAELQRQVDAQTAVVEQAELARQQAIEAAERAATAEAAKAREVAQLEERMRQMAVDVYVSPPSEQRLSVILKGGDLNELSTAMVYFDAKFGMDVDIAQQLERTRVQLTARRKAAREAVTAAAARSDQVAAALTELHGVQSSQQELAAVLAQRIGELDAEGAAVEAEDAALDAELTRRRDELLALASRQTGGDDIPLVTVEGIQIHAALAVPLQAMLAAAEADGIILRGGGYRSFEAQVATRRNNCGADDYAIWEMPASQCSPPTARPGTSMHETGMAVDFTHDGAIISTRTSPAFLWLAEHAELYGFHNLPSEPWHWSTTGG